MATRPMNPTAQERIAAYQLAIDSLPRQAEWQSALAQRTDGCSPHGVFDVLGRLKMDYQSSVGNLADGNLGPGSNDDGSTVNATANDTLIAYRLAIDALPRAGEWQTAALAQRDDGTRAAGIVHVLDHLRMDLHIRIGDLLDQVIQGEHDGR